MKKQFVNLTEITDRSTYDAAMKYLNELVDYGTKKGYFADPEADNRYTREFGRIGRMTADYESIYMDLDPLKVKNPLLIKIENELKKQSLNQRRAAELLEVKENTLSQILSGKRGISMQMAKRLYHVLKIDPKTIIEFA